MSRRCPGNIRKTPRTCRGSVQQIVRKSSSNSPVNIRALLSFSELVSHCTCSLVFLVLPINPMNGLKKNFFRKIVPLWNRRQCFRIDSKLVPREILTCWSGIWRQKPSIPPPRPQNWEKRYLKKMFLNPFAGLFSYVLTAFHHCALVGPDIPGFADSCKQQKGECPQDSGVHCLP